MYKCKDNKDAEALYKKFLHLCFYVITSYPRNRSTIITASVSIKYTFPIAGQLSVEVSPSSQTSIRKNAETGKRFTWGIFLAKEIQERPEQPAKKCIIMGRRKSDRRGKHKMERLEVLIPLAASGDKEAFNQLYEYSFSTVEHECLRILHNSLDAEDAIQESYLIIYKKLKTIKDPSSFLGWCRTIAHNQSVSYIANRKRKAGKDELKPPVSYDDYSGMDTLDGEDTEPTPTERAEQEMVRGFLQKAMDSIAPIRALCLAMYQQGYSYADISAKLSIPIGTVKSNIHYAKEALKKEIRRIEREENVQIFGFTLVPLANRVEVRMEQPETGGFISAETTTTSLKDNIWDNVSKSITRSSAAGMPLWRKILAVAVAVVVIVGGIIFAVNRAGRQNVENKQVTTTVSQGAQSIRRAAQQRLAPSNRNAVPGNGGGLTAAGRPEVTATQAVTASRTTALEPQEPRSTTREYFTNRVQNIRNAVQGDN